MAQERDDWSSGDGTPESHSDENDDLESQSHSSEDSGRNLEVCTFFHY